MNPNKVEVWEIWVIFRFFFLVQIDLDDGWCLEMIFKVVGTFCEALLMYLMCLGLVKLENVEKGKNLSQRWGSNLWLPQAPGNTMSLMCGGVREPLQVRCGCLKCQQWHTRRPSLSFSHISLFSPLFHAIQSLDPLDIEPSNI